MKKATKIINHEKRCHSLYANQGLFDYKSEALQFGPTCVVEKYFNCRCPKQL